MIAAIVLYAVLGLTGIYGTSKVVDTYTHLDDNDTRRYEKCVEHAGDVSQCRSLE